VLLAAAYSEYASLRCGAYASHLTPFDRPGIAGGRAAREYGVVVAPDLTEDDRGAASLSLRDSLC
jgi:hypothetical protein